ncbi:tyrosine-type recombinase/integrase [Hyphococcus flavus]|uniref:Tyrosine-type recombinase/integrase n=1 Tax=Hyphococcus flavus TaxID=1866326 RepID=A0AAE9ZDK6_9PROT|nr:site-specific integrase [Hyphococcus flavus]WDI30542.1 tyrosine-type recombinase/integrase [Hyphococcus flavus]
MAGKITKRRVDAAKPDETLWDSVLPGFGLRVFASGARSYVLKYRRGSVQRWFTIGRHGVWTPEQARKEAKRLIGRIEEGADPARDKALDRNAETLEAFAERYLEDYSRAFKKPSSAGDDAANLKNHIIPALGRLNLKDITRSDIKDFHLSMKATPYAANRCRALLSHMFKKAEAWGVRPDGSNPTLHVEKFKEKSRDRHLSARELRRLGRVMRVLDKSERWPYEVAAIRLLLFTGARLNEILSLRWEHVDFQARLLRLPDSKTGEKTIALAAPALELLSNLPRQDKNPHVICGRKKGAHLVNLQKPWRRIRKAALLDDVRLHDLRHSFASVAAAGGQSLPLIGSLLGHKQPQTTQRYAHFADDPRLTAADATANAIFANLGGKSGEIVALKKA